MTPSDFPAADVQSAPSAAGNTTASDDQREMLRIGEWDWWATPSGYSLHAADTVDIDGEYETSGYGRTVCGKRSWLSIPGMFSRMGAMRCARCCDALGWPRGKGSPKNDTALRTLVEQRISERGL